jgi:hypothetical protein
MNGEPPFVAITISSSVRPLANPSVRNVKYRFSIDMASLPE